MVLVIFDVFTIPTRTLASSSSQLLMPFLTVGVAASHHHPLLDSVIAVPMAVLVQVGRPAML